MSLREAVEKATKDAPQLSAHELEAIMAELWTEIEPAPPNRILMTRETAVFIRDTQRAGERRRRRARGIRPNYGMLRQKPYRFIRLGKGRPA